MMMMMMNKQKQGAISQTREQTIKEKNHQLNIK